jgi:formyltetrahydrofolate synthetase
MSRAGKYPVKLKDGVSVAIVDNALVVKGSKGELKLALDTKNANLVDIAIEEGQVVITPKDAEEKASRAMWGTMARNVRSAVQGVSEGFAKGGEGAAELAQLVCDTIDANEATNNFHFLYETEKSIKEKVETIAKEIYDLGICLEEYLQMLTNSVG